jgi:GT2 family glycosyltransferase
VSAPSTPAEIDLEARRAPRSAASLSLLVVIVAWRSAELVIDALSSLVAEREDFASFRVIVVDNDSGDETADRIADAIDASDIGAWVRLERSPENGGFAAGNNRAYRMARDQGWSFDYFLLLNPDTVARRGALSLLCEFLEQHQQAGVAGGRSEDPDATAQMCSFRFPSMLGEFLAYLRLGPLDRAFEDRLIRVGIPEEPMRLDWVSGAFMAIRPQVLAETGLLDESFFLYFEETDLCFRAAAAGWECWHVPAARVVHHVGQSSGVNKRHSKESRRPVYWFQSRRRYFVLNHGVAYAALTDLLVVSAVALWRLRCLVTRQQDTDPPRFLGDFLRHSVLLRGARNLAPRRIS